jgi:putative heme iron utilization protein
LYQLEMLTRSHVRGALEQHVLEQVRESGPARLLVRRADVIPEVHSHDWRGMILRQRYEQPIVEMEGFYRNSHCRKLPAMQTLWNPLGGRA